jgi:hypothetical protein
VAGDKIVLLQQQVYKTTGKDLPGTVQCHCQAVPANHSTTVQCYCQAACCAHSHQICLCRDNKPAATCCNILLLRAAEVYLLLHVRFQHMVSSLLTGVGIQVLQDTHSSSTRAL